MKAFEYVVVAPPLEVFLDPKNVSWTWDKAGVTDGVRIEFSEDGLLYYPSKDSIPYRGFPYSPAIADVAVFKRFIILRIGSLRNPLNWFSLLFFKKELYDMAYTCIQHDFLKPEHYCRTAREIHRVIAKFFKASERLLKVRIQGFLAHCVAAILQWDVAYRYRVQAAAGFINVENFRKNPIRETWKVLGYAERMDDNLRVKKTWKMLKLAFILVCCLNQWKIRSILREVNVKELLMDSIDKHYAFP